MSEFGYFLLIIILFLLVVLGLILLLARGTKKDSTEYDNRYLWDLVGKSHHEANGEHK